MDATTLEKNETSWRELLKLAELIKTASMFAFAIYLTVTSLTLGIKAQDRPSMSDLERRVQQVELQKADVRLSVLETVSQEHTQKLNSIEALEWKVLLGIAALVGETVWQYIMRARRDKP